MPDIPGNSSTTATIPFGGTVTGSLETTGDHDWFRVSLTAGQQISITLNGAGSNALEDPYVYLRSSSGMVLGSDDDGGAGRNSELVFTVQTTGTYYIDVGAWTPDPADTPDGYTGTGTYQLSVGAYVAPVLSVWSNDQIASQLTHGYWGGSQHRFNVGPGDTLTVNLTALTAEGQFLARNALALWTDVIGVNFNEVSFGGAITFDDNEEGAHADAVWSGGITSSANVNVDSQWIADYGSSLRSYSFQTYIHEIGHALGLGHAGEYNGDASYSSDAMYLNDSWATTVMSYFDQTENSYFAGQGFSNNLTLTPMGADIVAMSNLYGMSSSTRLGNTTYGFNSTANRSIFDASQNDALTNPFAYTIIDSGGTDTLDYSGYSQAQLINLNAEAFSNIGGDTGNVVIARGTVIENAIGGSGNDTLLGNAANNVLDGGGGRNIISYQDATAAIVVNASLTAAQNTGGAGVDTLRRFAEIVGSRFDDVLTGRSTGAVLRGGEGNDRLISSSSADVLHGDAGDDVFVVSAASTVHGGAGFDTLDFSDARQGVMSSVGITGNGVERLIGSAYDDVLRGMTDADAPDVVFVLLGGAGNDRLEATFGSGRLEGGSGNDTYYVAWTSTTVVENLSSGTDRIESEISYVLGANVENLTLLYGAAINGTGNALANEISGGSGANRLYGLAGDDRLYGNAGNDTLDGGAGIDRLYGGLGDDIYTVRDATDYVYENAGEGVDRVISSVSHILRANVEQLSLTGTANLYGRGNAEANVISGNSGSNRLNGYDGADRLYGGAGNDVLDGGTGNDGMRGDAGNDVYYADSSRDVVIEGLNGGTDTVYSSATLTLRVNVERLSLTGTDAVKGTGNDLANIINGNAGGNTISGLAGNDRLFGHDGADALSGGDGNDQLDGGAARDRLTGGSGSDLFVFDDGDFGTMTGSGADQIVDFSRVERDRLDLRGVDANGVVSGDQAFSFVGTNAFTGTAGELRYEQISGSTFVQGDLDGNGAADFWIRLDGLHSLTAGDMLL